jgi:dimethylaniline monooxygenase (N-oxide forming)
MPYISAPYRSTGLVERIRSSIIQAAIPDTGGKKIDLAPWPESIDAQGRVHFRATSRPEAARMQGLECKPDVLVLATGYSQSFPFLDANYPTPDEADIRSVWKTGDETVGFIGFVRPSFGKTD